MDERGCQLNNEVGTIIAKIRAIDSQSLNSFEKRENVSVIACINLEGLVLPPVIIFEGLREYPVFSKVFLWVQKFI